jgi:hypothetical protein
MPAGAVGASWVSGAWPDTVFEANAWAGAGTGGESVPSSSVVTRVSWKVGFKKALEIITVTWVADSGDGSVTAISLGRVNGVIERMVTVPGSPAPTADYDITVTDSNSVDVMGGAGADRSDTTAQEAASALDTFRRRVSDTLTLSISGNSVNSAAGTVRLYVRK